MIACTTHFSFGLDSHIWVFSTSLYSVIVVALFLHVSGLSSHREVHIHKAVLCPHQQPIRLLVQIYIGGPVIVPVTLVTVPLSNNGAKTAAKPSGTCPITIPSVSHMPYGADLYRWTRYRSCNAGHCTAIQQWC